VTDDGRGPGDPAIVKDVVEHHLGDLRTFVAEIRRGLAAE
jgi:hypothetical protein